MAGAGAMRLRKCVWHVEKCMRTMGRCVCPAQLWMICLPRRRCCVGFGGKRVMAEGRAGRHVAVKECVIKQKRISNWPFKITATCWKVSGYYYSIFSLKSALEVSPSSVWSGNVRELCCLSAITHKHFRAGTMYLNPMNQWQTNFKAKPQKRTLGLNRELT